MILRARFILPLLLLAVAVLVGIALLLPVGGERLIASASTKVAGDRLRTCLAARLGLSLPWAGDPHNQHAAAFGIRVIVRDDGRQRQVGVFTAGGRPLNGGQAAALEACLGGQS